MLFCKMEQIDLNKKCRTCGETLGEFQNLFDEYEDSGVTLAEIVTNTTSFQVLTVSPSHDWICQNCSKIVNDFYVFKNRFQQLQSIDLELSNSNTDPLITTTEHQQITTYMCPKCNTNFLEQSELEYHMKIVHNTIIESYKELCEISVIQLNDINTTSSVPVKKRSKTDNKSKAHSKKFPCEICNAKFSRRSYLKDHLDTHSDEKHHQCPYCKKSFQRRTVLAKHKRLHTHPRQCICEFCGKAFNDKTALQTHLSLLHIKDKPQKCPICGMRFTLKTNLNKHIERHLTIREIYQCPDCAAKYYDKSSLNRHFSIKHAKTAIICEGCGKTYLTTDNLLKHQQLCSQK